MSLHKQGAVEEGSRFRSLEINLALSQSHQVLGLGPESGHACPHPRLQNLSAGTPTKRACIIRCLGLPQRWTRRGYVDKLF